MDAIDRLNSDIPKTIGIGIKLAYDIATENFIEGGNNRVILVTDNDFYIGLPQSETAKLVEEKGDDGIPLTILKFLSYLEYPSKSNPIEKIADKGSGKYYFINTLNEAEKALNQELGPPTFTVAKNVNIQVEFNPSKIKTYRLIGYDYCFKSKHEFYEEKKNTYQLTAFYELIPDDSFEELNNVDDLYYHDATDIKNENYMTVKLTYKKPDEDVSKIIKKSFNERDITQELKGDFEFAASVVEFGLVLRRSIFKGQASYDHALHGAKESKGQDPYGYRQELIDLIEKAIVINARYIDDREKLLKHSI